MQTSMRTMRSGGPRLMCNRDGLRALTERLWYSAETVAKNPCCRVSAAAKKPAPTEVKRPQQVCRSPSIAISGFGRIGKCLLRLAAASDVNVVALNQPFVDASAIARSLIRDTVHGPFLGKVTVRDDSLCVNGKHIKVFHEEKPENIKWKDVPVDYVIDATGKFTGVEDATKHISAGAKKVIISAPSKDAPMFVRGVNFDCYKKTMAVVSNASCTTNCAAPLINIMHKKFGVVNCLLTTAHAITSSQHVTDGLNYTRSAVSNIVPAPTGAAKAVGAVITELKDKVHGDSMRVPVLDVSLLKLYINLRDKASVDDIKAEIKKQSECSVKDVVTYYEKEKYVSSDFLGSQYSAIVDFDQIKVMDKFVTISAWYDNEIGYAKRLLDLVQHMIEVDEKM